MTKDSSTTLPQTQWIFFSLYQYIMWLKYVYYHTNYFNFVSLIPCQQQDVFMFNFICHLESLFFILIAKRILHSNICK